MPDQMVQVSNALAEQRATKKRAQDDVKLLANRIALLKLEEKKVSDPFKQSETDRLESSLCPAKIHSAINSKCFHGLADRLTVSYVYSLSDLLFGIMGQFTLHL